MAIIGRGVKSFRDNSISAHALICMRQPLSAVSPDGTRRRSRAVTPLYGIAAAHPFAVLASAKVGQIFRTGDPHGARSVARHYRKLSAFCGSRGRYRKKRQQGECRSAATLGSFRAKTPVPAGNGWDTSANKGTLYCVFCWWKRRKQPRGATQTGDVGICT